jgi:pimeloyl-ACP methyl ester carboxylesterase
MSGMITLDTHITDVVNVVRWESLENFVLVGHSYGGWIISGAAEQVEKKIASIVFLDAFMPENGQRVLDTNSPRSRAEIEEALKRAEVSRPPPHPSVWKVNEKDQAWVQEKFTAQPIGVAFTPIRLTGARDRVPKKTYVRATGYDNPNFEKAYAKVKADPSWRTFEMPCGHEVMIDCPSAPPRSCSRWREGYLPARTRVSRSAVGQPSAGMPSLICMSRMATRLLSPSTPSTRPTS